MKHSFALKTNSNDIVFMKEMWGTREHLNPELM